jgi:hypothetical protein
VSTHHDSHSPGDRPKYELRDVHVPAILKSGYSVFITVIVAFALMWLTYKGFEKLPSAVEGAPPTAMEMDRRLPPGPPLLVDEPATLKQFRASEEAVLQSYQKDLRSGAIRIPVSEAMKAVARRGIGIVTAPQQPEAPK